MNLNRIKEIIDSPITNKGKESLIIDEISKNEDVLIELLMILESERKRKRELIIEMNLLLSKANIGLNEPKFNKGGFMQKEIAEFYDKNEVNYCFKQTKLI